MTRAARLAAVVGLWTWLQPAPALADWLITPFIGTVFGGNTNIINLSGSAGDKKLIFGGSFALLGDGPLGVEGDFSLSPHFFETARATLVQQSTVTTLTGNVILAVPVAVTRESLRPYLVGGVGLMHASSTDVVDAFSFDSNVLALNIGGGAIGMLTNRTGVRFEIRQFRNLTPDSNTTTTSGSTRLSFWRATVGVTLRY